MSTKPSIRNPPWIVLAVLLLSQLLTACAGATPYRPLEHGEGYQEQRLESNRYRVSFDGNSATPRRTVENYLLYRAAELTLADGYDYFVLAGESAEQKRDGPSIGFSIGGFRIGSGGGFGIGIGTGTGKDRQLSNSAIVTLFRGRKPEGNAQAFDAREVRSHLEASILRPAAAAR